MSILSAITSAGFIAFSGTEARSASFFHGSAVFMGFLAITYYMEAVALLIVRELKKK